MSESLEHFEGMTVAELRDLIQRAQSEVRSRSEKQIEELRQLAQEAGYEVTLTKIGEEEGRGGRRRSGGDEGGIRRRGKVKAKYRNPDNPGEAWSGRGRQPKWVQMALAHDRTLEDLAIPA